MLGGFGMAKGGSDPNLTQTGAAVGVAQYMSPEQVKGMTALDGRSDLYSAGVVLYEAVTGQVPFNASSQFEVMLAHVNSAPKAPSALNPELPEGFDDVLLKALAKDPAKRFQTAVEFIETLDTLESTVQAETALKTAAAVAVMKPPAEPHSRSGSSQPASLAAASGIAPPRMPAPSPDAVAAALKPQRWPFGTGGREWTWGELIVAGILASAIGSLFVALMTGMLHVGGAR
jgi:serine/threonine-protein kinase